MTGKYHALPERYIQKIEKRKRRDDQNVVVEFRRLPQDEKEKYLQLSRDKNNGLVKNGLILEILAAYLWKDDISKIR